ncbi:MAG: hypothetical protein FWF40_03415 [Methanomassiliicoccaceae archaeon]|nr:hypothetical protein [Methanomassiliicoccaceae archaeon]
MRNELCIAGRIDSFVSRPDAGMLRGERRMGTERLLDMLADRIAEDECANVIRVKEVNEIQDIASKIVPCKIDHILLYTSDAEAFDAVLREFPNACVYGAKELCHQVPVCFRGSPMTGHGDLCSL